MDIGWRVVDDQYETGIDDLADDEVSMYLHHQRENKKNVQPYKGWLRTDTTAHSSGIGISDAL